MTRIKDLVENYERHLATPWQKTVSGAERVIILVYAKEMERAIRGGKGLFEEATIRAGHKWVEVDLSDCFAKWLAADEYRESYFTSPDDLQLKLEAEFTAHVAEVLRTTLKRADVTGDTVVAVLGAASLYGFTHISQVLRLVEPDISGRLLVFFPGQHEGNDYQLLDARHGWDYLAIPITLHSQGGYE